MSNETNHFRLWNRIADTGESKEAAFTHLWRGEGYLENYCFACEEATKRWEIAHSTMKWLRGIPKCSYCPINWGASDCESGNSPYVDFCLAERADDPKAIKFSAEEVLALDWNPASEDIDNE